MHNKSELHLTCSCHTHELHVEKDFEDPMWYFSYWIRGYQEDSPWKYRLRCIWQVLKNGRPYGDEVILEKHHMQELLEYIQEQLDATKDKC